MATTSTVSCTMVAPHSRPERSDSVSDEGTLLGVDVPNHRLSLRELFPLFPPQWRNGTSLLSPSHKTMGDQSSDCPFEHLRHQERQDNISKVHDWSLHQRSFSDLSNTSETLFGQMSRQPTHVNTTPIGSKSASEAEDEGPAKPARSMYDRFFRDWWGLEILSLFFSTVCIAVIVIMLHEMDGKETSHWSLGVSIDAVLAVIAGFSKSSLLMPTAEALGQLKWIWPDKSKPTMDFERIDKASRGRTWGSLALLASTRGVTLASIGAAILLLSVPLDIFYQQIVSYPLAAVVDQSDNATISRLIWYDPDPGTKWRGNQYSYVPEDNQIFSTLLPYFRGQGMAPGVLFDCPTGNCTYDPFHTLSMVHQCKQLPVDTLQFGCFNTSAEWLSLQVYIGPNQNPNVTSCGYYLPVPDYYPQLMSGYEVLPNGNMGEVLAARVFPLWDVQTNDKYYNGSISFPEVKAPIVSFIITSTPAGFDGAARNETPTAVECEVHWVVQQLQSSVKNGVLKENVLSTEEFSFPFDNPWDPIDDAWYRNNFSMTLPDPHSVIDAKQSEYGMNNVSAYAAWGAFAVWAPSTYTRPVKSNGTDKPVMKMRWLDYELTHLYEILDFSPWMWTPEFEKAVDTHVGAMADVTNQVIRQNPQSVRNRHDVAVGTAYRYIVFVEVRWEWLAFPVALWLIAFCFLVSTIWRSSSRRNGTVVPIYKSSTLPLAFSAEELKGRSMGSLRRVAKTRRMTFDIAKTSDDSSVLKSPRDVEQGQSRLRIT